MPALGLALGLSFARPNGNSFAGALDDYTSNLGPVWYIPQKLLTAYDGPAVDVQQTDGGAVTSINYLPNGSLDEATLLTLAAGGDLFISKLYDQNGSLDLTQATFANMPRIVNDGVVEDGAYFVNNGNLSRASVNLTDFFGSATGQVLACSSIIEAGANSALFNWQSNAFYLWNFFGGDLSWGEANGALADAEYTGNLNTFQWISLELGGDSKKIVVDGVTRASATGSSANSGSGAFSLGGLSAGSYPTNGNIRGLIAWKNNTGATGRLESMLAPRLIVADGDSITAGSGSTVGLSWPYLLRAEFGLNADVKNYGISGQTMNTMNSNAATNVDPLVTANRTTKISVGFAGTNDLYFGANAATTLARLKTYGAARKAAGFLYIQPTILPRTPGSSGGGDGTFEADRQTVNTEIRNPANLGVYWDAVADIASDSRIGNANDNLDLDYYQNDGTHPNAAGQVIIADIILASIVSLT